MIEIRDYEDEILDLIARYRAASGPGMQLLNLLGGSVDDLIQQLPVAVQDRLTGATEKALNIALGVATESRRAVPDQAGWLNSAVATTMGAVGGFGGISSSLIELPVTTTILLRAIQGVAVDQGFEVESEAVRFDCIRVIGSAGPLARDDGTNLGFLSARITLTGATMQRVIATVATRFAAALGHKLAAQTVPVLGALAGAATNYVYTSYYQEMAYIHFRLRRLALEMDQSYHEILADLAQRITKSTHTHD